MFGLSSVRESGGCWAAFAFADAKAFAEAEAEAETETHTDTNTNTNTDTETLRHKHSDTRCSESASARKRAERFVRAPESLLNGEECDKNGPQFGRSRMSLCASRG